MSKFNATTSVDAILSGNTDVAAAKSTLKTAVTNAANGSGTMIGKAMVLGNALMGQLPDDDKQAKAVVARFVELVSDTSEADAGSLRAIRSNVLSSIDAGLTGLKDDTFEAGLDRIAEKARTEKADAKIHRGNMRKNALKAVKDAGTDAVNADGQMSDAIVVAQAAALVAPKPESESKKKTPAQMAAWLSDGRYNATEIRAIYDALGAVLVAKEEKSQAA